MRWSVLAVGVTATALGVRVVRARHRRFLHPDGRSFRAELHVTGTGGRQRTGAVLLDRPGRWAATVRISKGVGTAPGRGDVLGVAVRVHGPGPDERRDLLLSTAGTGRLTRHLPTLRSSFDTRYGSILPYRTGTGRKILLAAVPDPVDPPLGDTLESVVQAAARGASLLLALDDGGGLLVLGRIALHEVLPAAQGAALAFDPVRNTTVDLHPTGLIHASRAGAYRLGQRWRGAVPARPDTGAVTRTAAHR